jgi:Kef-type K+ transport system membrane component KefB/nucleotide-binding universal stress UspA family protein
MLVLSTPLVTQPVPIFFIVLGIILLAPVLLNKLKIPHIVSMIVAGVIIGPHGLNILDRDSSFAIFGQVGLLYLMFLAGLEIDMYQLRLNLRRGVVFGILTLLIPLFFGVITSQWLLHLNLTTSLFLGAMYAAHTLLAYPITARFGITKTPAVLIAIVGTIIAVVGSLMVLAVTANMHREGRFEFSSIATMLAMMIVYCGAVLYLYPRLTRQFFKSYNDKVTQYVYIMAMVFLAAWVAQLIGLEAVLGAFFAGLVLNRYVPAASPLMSSIEFVGNALFIPYFLISVGMMINISVVLNPDTLTVASLMLCVAIVSKWIPAFICQKLHHLDRPSRRVIFGLTTAHTAVALAVVTLGHNLNMFDQTILNATIVVILVSCAIAPLITSAGASKLAIKMMQDEDPNDPAVLRRARVNNTLIALSQPNVSKELVNLAILMRNDSGNHSMYGLNVRHDATKATKKASESILDKARREAAAADIKLNTIERYDLNTVTGIVNVMQERDITELIMGLHRRSTVIDSFFGSNVEQLLRATNKMLIISRCFIPVNTVTRIVVAVPEKAQYETGFSRWVRCLSRLTRQLGCRIIFACPDEIQPLIRAIIYQENYGIRCEFRSLNEWDDFILLSNRVLSDDLLVIIGARANSVSYSSSMVELPSYLQRYCANNNLMYIYPEQFGETPPMTYFTDPLASDIVITASPLLLKVRGIVRKADALRRKLLGHKPHPRNTLR